MKIKSILILFFLGSCNTIFSITISDKLNLSGMLRFRQLYYQSQSDIPGYLEGNGSKEVTYADLFFRNRISLNLLPNANIFTVFDIYSVFGKDNGQISSSDLGFQVRNVFAEFNIFKEGKLSVGYLTFTLPEGVILATNGAGLKYEHSFLNNFINPYIFWIKAYDHSLDTLTNGVGVSDFKDNDILIAGSRINPAGNHFKINLFYVLNFDPDKELHWAGLSSDIIIANSKVNFMGIYNAGKYSDGIRTYDISSGLLRLAFTYEKIIKSNKLTASAVLEGATGLAGNSFSSDRFMGINPSYGINNIAIDNTAAMTIFKGGDIHGLVCGTLIAGYNINEFEFKIIYSHMRWINNIVSSNSIFGNEADLNITYDNASNYQVFLQTGFFFPGQGYSKIAIKSIDTVYEITGGIVFKY